MKTNPAFILARDPGATGGGRMGASPGVPVRDPGEEGAKGCPASAFTAILRFSTVITVPAVVLACTVSPPVNVADPFLGDWVTTEDASVTIRPDTIVQHQPDGESTTLDTAACRGRFRFGRGTKSRQDLTSLVPRQPDLRQKISDILVEQSYPIAELNCDRGDQTYVLLNDRQLLAIYRDGDIGAIEQLARR